jgi:hypothetical protein
MTIRALRAVMLLVLGACAARAALAQGGPVPAPQEQTGVPGQGRPDMRPERVALEVVAGTYAGLAGYFVGRSVGTVATMMMSVEQDRTRDRIVHATGIVGGAFAIGGTVFAIGDMGSETGSFRATMLGVGIGAVASELLSRAVFHQDHFPADHGSATRKWLMATLESSLPAIGGTIAFNSSRKWQR